MEELLQEETDKSVFDEVLALAKAGGMEAVNALEREAHNRHLNHIMAPGNCCHGPSGRHCPVDAELWRRYAAIVRVSCGIPVIEAAKGWACLQGDNQLTPEPTMSTEAEAIPIDGDLRTFPATLEYAA